MLYLLGHKIMPIFCSRGNFFNENFNFLYFTLFVLVILVSYSKTDTAAIKNHRAKI